MYERSTHYLGAGEPEPEAAPVGPSAGDVAKKAAAVALIYHGYKRTGSLALALLYGLAGRYVPTVAVPVALAQGFGKKKECP